MNKRQFIKIAGGFVAGVAMNLGFILPKKELTIAKIKEGMDLIATSPKSNIVSYQLIYPKIAQERWNVVSNESFENIIINSIDKLI